MVSLGNRRSVVFWFLLLPGLLCRFLVIDGMAKEVPDPRTVTLTAADGTLLKVTYFAAGKPGPGVLLLHQCNRQRKVWNSLAERLAAMGINVLTVDNRGFGESGGPRFDELKPDEARKMMQEQWPGDFDAALQYLVSQPGVKREDIGAGGASCGVNNSVQLARRHREVKSLILLSGTTDREGRLFLQASKGLPVFTAAADDDEFGNLTEMMQWLCSVSSNSASRFALYAKGGHGTDMFAANKELPSMIAEWFRATLMHKPGNAPKSNGSRLDPQVVRNLQLIDSAGQPGGAGKLQTAFPGARLQDPKEVSFPEAIVNLLGYEHIQLGDTKGAVEIMKLNAMKYPSSPNVYDSLADAYLADGQKDLARENAKKALELLANHTTEPEARRKAIQKSAEQKLKQLDMPRP
jgi:dienelactone hydrolase